MTQKFLMISPYYPPMSFVGAKRALTFSEHLPQHGWTPAVVALPAHIDADPVLADRVPEVPMLRTYQSGPLAKLMDWRAARQPKEAYGDNRASTTNVHTPGLGARLWHELSALPIDRFMKFLPWVAPGVLRFAREQDVKLVYVNAGPFSAMYFGTALAKLLRLPLVLDLRDPWAIDPIYREAWGALGQRMADAVEQAAFTRASRVVLNSDATLTAYREAYAGRLPAEHFARIRNHFDPDLYGPYPAAPTAEGCFRIVYYGHLAPLRDGRLFFAAYRRFIDAEGLKPGDTELLTLGERTPADEAALDQLELRPFVKTHPWLPFTESRSLLSAADLLLDLTSPRHALRLAGKLYDYLAARRPILSVSANLEMHAILAHTKMGTRVGHDEAAIAAALSTQLAAKRAGTPFEPDDDAIATYTAAPAAEAMAQIFNEATK